MLWLYAVPRTRFSVGSPLKGLIRMAMPRSPIHSSYGDPDTLIDKLHYASQLSLWPSCCTGGGEPSDDHINGTSVPRHPQIETGVEKGVGKGLNVSRFRAVSGPDWTDPATPSPSRGIHNALGVTPASRSTGIIGSSSKSLRHSPNQKSIQAALEWSDGGIDRTKMRPTGTGNRITFKATAANSGTGN